MVSNIFVGLLFIPKLGEDEPILSHIFQGGCNHQPVFFFYEKLRVSFIVQFDAGNEGRFLRSIQSLKRVSVNFKFRKSNMKVYKYENTARWVDPIHRLYRLL